MDLQPEKADAKFLLDSDKKGNRLWFQKYTLTDLY